MCRPGASFSLDKLPYDLELEAMVLATTQKIYKAFHYEVNYPFVLDSLSALDDILKIKIRLHERLVCKLVRVLLDFSTDPNSHPFYLSKVFETLALLMRKNRKRLSDDVKSSFIDINILFSLFERVFFPTHSLEFMSPLP